MRLLFAMCSCALIPIPAQGEDPNPDPKAWATLKGIVVFPKDKPIPVRKALNAAPGCVLNGPLLDEVALVNPMNRGIKNVVVFLRPLDPEAKGFPLQWIHPDDSKRKTVEHVVTQPCCMFENRVIAARVGDSILVKNPAALVHNFFWESGNNGSYNVNIPMKGQWAMPQPLVAESFPIQYRCTVHTWMTGYVRIFDHPYFAVTDENGKFEIKNAPVASVRIVYWHETGLRGGREGRFGEPLAITGPTLELKPVDFNVTPK